MASSMLVLSELNNLAATPTHVLTKINIGNFTEGGVRVGMVDMGGILTCVRDWGPGDSVSLNLVVDAATLARVQTLEGIVEGQTGDGVFRPNTREYQGITTVEVRLSKNKTRMVYEMRGDETTPVGLLRLHLTSSRAGASRST